MSDTKKRFLLKKIDPAKPRIITWPVPVPVPVDGGKTEEQELTAKFAIISSEQMDQLTSLAAIQAFEADKTKPRFGSPLLWEVVKGFEGFREEEGGPVLSDEEAVPLLLSHPTVCVALTTEYYALQNGRARKN